MTVSGHVEIVLKLAIFVVSSQIFHFSGHAGKKQVVNRACCAAEFAFCCTVRIALQNSQRALICHRVPAQPGGGPGGGIAKKNLSKFPEVDIPQRRTPIGLNLFQITHFQDPAAFGGEWSARLD